MKHFGDDCLNELKFYFDGTVGKPFEGTVDVDMLLSKNRDSDTLAKLPFYYSDSFFSHSACSYDHALAKMSLGVTMSAFTYKKEGDKHIRALLNAIGCDGRSIKTEKYDTNKPMDDSCAFALGTKRLPGGYYLIPVFIRSHRYGGEWVSNAHAIDPTCPDHAAGFKLAADKTYDSILRYIDTKALDKERVKLWICGFSRGGAISNLLGARLALESGISKDNIFVYTFAAPRCVLDNSAVFIDNVFNIVSEMDSVPRIPPALWGFTRYGTDLYLPCKARRGAEEYAARLQAMKDEFGSIMQQLGISDTEYLALEDQEIALDLFIDYIDDLVDTREKYVSGGYQQILMDYLKKRIEGSKVDPHRFLMFLLDDNRALADDIFSLIGQWHELGTLDKVHRIGRLPAKMKPGDSSPASEMIKMCLGIFVRYAAKFTATKVTGKMQDYYYEQLVTLLVDLYHNREGSAVLMQHWPEAYLAWLNSGSEHEIFRTTSYRHNSVK